MRIEEIEIIQNQHCDEISKIQFDLQNYQREIELINQIFKRIENNLFSNNIDEREKMVLFKRFKEQLEYEIDNFKKKDEGKLIEYIRKFYSLKFQLGENLLK